MATVPAQIWHNAQKLRREIMKEIDQLKKDSGGEKATAHFERIDIVMQSYRLACVQTLVSDVHFASQERVDTALWQTHASITTCFRQLLPKLRSPQQVVLKRKTEKLYLSFLTVSQYFYRGFLQRLCAHYRIARLESLARSLELEALPTMTADKTVDAAADGTDGLVLAVCHRLLIALGDLSRYKNQTRQQKKSPSTALTYYGLANDLIPASGWGHHQKGVIHLDGKRHFEILYHFLRAWAAQKPHPNAAGNLELELRELLKSTPPESHLSRDVLKSRFVWIHALMNQGQPFKEHVELEQEVMSRFATTLKGLDSDQTLLQVVLMNVCAYQYAQQRRCTSPSETVSQACQYILQLNVRMIRVLAEISSSELREVSKQTIASPAESEGQKGSQGNSTIESCLPLLRVLMFWLAIHRGDVTECATFLETELEGMYRALGEALTVLLGVYGGTQLLSVPYLLPEDVEMQGIKSIEDTDLGAPFHLLQDDKGLRKPRWFDSAETSRATPEVELLGRAFDILKLGFFLAGDDSIPLAVESGQCDGRQITTVRFANAIGGESGQRSSDVESHEPGVAPVQDAQVASAAGQEQQAETRRAEATRPSRSTAAPPDEPAIASSASETEETDAGFDEDRLMNMVGDFLVPPESEKRQTAGPSQRATSASCAVDTALANGAWNNAVTQTESSTLPPTSANGRGFPSLPWGYFLPPSPNAPEQYPFWQHGTSTAAHPGPGTGKSNVPAAPLGTAASVQGAGQLEDPFALSNDVRRYNGLIAAAPEGSAAAWAQAEQYKLSSKGLLYQEQAAQGIYSGCPATPLPPQTNAQGWNTPSPEPPFVSAGAGLASQTRGQLLNADSHVIPPSTNFSGIVSSLPPVNSPWGLPNAQGPWQEPRQSSHAIVGVPNSNSGGSLQSNKTKSPGLVYNGVTYSGTTAYGRGSIATRDDPTHFKNAIKSSGLAGIVAEADEYDRKVLASALEDNKSNNGNNNNRSSSSRRP